jgi:expansin (peptidoglycan-binding protein)
MALQYGPATVLSITAGGLVSNANRSSAAVTTSTATNVVQVMLEVSVLTTSIAPTGNKQVVVYGYKSLDGSTFSGASAQSDNVDGTDKLLNAIGSPTNLTFLGTVQLNTGAVAATVRGEFEVTNAFGCVPPKWGIVLVNDAGVSLGATVTAQYREIYYS